MFASRINFFDDYALTSLILWFYLVTEAIIKDEKKTSFFEWTLVNESTDWDLLTD